MSNDFQLLVRELRSALGFTGAKHPNASTRLLGNAEQRKNRGRWETLTLGGQAKPLLSVEGDPQQSEVVFITCAVQSHANEDTSDLPQVVGTLQWGSDGGAVQSVDFDFLRGATLSVAGNFVSVTARIEAAPGSVTDCSVGAFIGYGVKASGPAQRTLGAELNNGDVALMDVPRFARSVRVLRAVPGASLGVAWLDAAGAALASWTASTDFPLVVPAGAVSLRITNVSGAATRVRAVFELSI